MPEQLCFCKARIKAYLCAGIQRLICYTLKPIVPVNIRLFLSLLLSLIGCYASAQAYDQTCYFGFSFEISDNNAWGYGEPVITQVDPYSNAAKAGLKPGDIIMEVNGKATYLRHYDLIASWLFEDNSNEVKFTIRNLNNTFKEVPVSRYCRNSDAVTESELADWYSLYSVEGNNTRHFSLPMVVRAYSEVDFTDYYTYDFIFKEKTTEIDDYIVHQIEKGLNRRGLTRDVNDPDILIQIYYSYEPNKNYRPDALSDSKIGEMRYDVDLQRMVKVPVDSAKTGADASNIKGSVHFGFQFFEKKYIQPGQLTQIWDVELQEYIAGDYSLQDYCQMHVPLMIAAYPYQSPTSEMKYSVDFKEYNYTGINFNRKDLCTIENVDKDSPAFAAGLREGDKVMSVNGIPFAHSAFDSKNAYADFVGETMAFRDISAGFYNDKVKDYSYPWYVDSYGKIGKEFRKKHYAAGMSYLFAFERYVNSKPSPELTFEIQRRGQAFSFKVVPQKRKSANLVNNK